MGGYGDIIGGIAQTGDEGPEQDKTGGNLITKIVGLNAKWENENRRERESREQSQAELRQNAAVSQARNDQRAYEAEQDMRPEMTGRLKSEYLTPDMLMANDVNDIGGGALKTLLNAASGYNPVAAADPRMNVYGSDQRAMANLKTQAEQNTADTIGGWEAAMGELGDQYTESAGKLAGERDEMRDLYKEKVADNRDAYDAEMPENIVNAWLASDDKRGIEGQPQLRKYGGFRNKDYVAADRDKKREYVQGLLDSGFTYASLLNDPAFVEMIMADPNTRGLFTAWDKEGLADA